MTIFVKDVDGVMHRFDRFETAKIEGDVVQAFCPRPDGSKETVRLDIAVWQDALRDTAPWIPATPGFSVIHKFTNDDGSVSPLKVAVVAWRRFEGMAVPVTMHALNEPDTEGGLWEAVHCPDDHIEHGDGGIHFKLQDFLEAPV